LTGELLFVIIITDVNEKYCIIKTCSYKLGTHAIKIDVHLHDKILFNIRSDAACTSAPAIRLRGNTS